MASRQALTSIRSTFASSSSSSRLRLVHSSAPSRATLQVTVAFAAAEPEEITLAPIFDIFDAPSRLEEHSKLIRSSAQPRRLTPEEAESSTKYTALPRPPPSTLPAPVMFDGPARPRNLPLAFQRRVEQAPSSAPASTRQTRQHHTPSVPPTTSSEPLIELFEGPARLSRYSHRPSSQQGVSELCSLSNYGALTSIF
ncbi:hypothetical protein AN958_07325 [Leucoagaricus sp. SymC.cos]|nr:hypothetical protein AN958_07325 [Leucoagaricus sp. SymC.cos]